ncbi:uncharacterized protein ISCGN_032291 [Ixodes scapularis]
MPLYGRLEPFDGDGSAWPVYEEQVHVFFRANDTPEAKQRDIFLASCGTRVFSLLLDLLKPATPHVKTLGELLATLRSHFSPAPSTLMERFRFNNRSRQDGETLGQFVAALRGLASTCAFGDQLDSLLRDRFVCGINNSCHADATPGAPRPLAGRRGEGSAGDGSSSEGRQRDSACGRLTVDGSGGEQDGGKERCLQPLRCCPLPLTVPVLCANMDGTDKRELLLIGKSKKPRGFATIMSLPVTYVQNGKAWTTGDLFRKWLTDFDANMASQNWKVLPLLDNGSAHHINPLFSAVEVLFLPPNTTARHQPMDQDLKVHYHRRVIKRLLTDVRTAVPPKERKVTLARAVFMASGAWRDVKPETIAHCFKSGGLSRTRVLEAPAASDEVVAGPEYLLSARSAHRWTRCGRAWHRSALLDKMWESLAQVQLVPFGVNLVEFVTTEDDIVATEKMTDEDLANCGLVEDVRANKSHSDSNCYVKLSISTGTAIAAADVLRSYFWWIRVVASLL